MAKARKKPTPALLEAADANGELMVVGNLVEVEPSLANMFRQWVGRIGTLDKLQANGAESPMAWVQFSSNKHMGEDYALLLAHEIVLVPTLSATLSATTELPASPTHHALQYVLLADIELVSNTRSSYDEAALDELTASIRQHGVMQNVLLCPHPNTLGRYQLAAGHRRYLAASRAGLQELPAAIRPMTPHEFLEIQTLENLQREALNPADEAQAFAMLLAHDFTLEEIAARLGKSPGFVANRAQLAQLVPELEHLLRSGRLHVGAAQLLARHAKAVQHQVVVGDLASCYEKQISLSMAQQWSQRYLRELARAPFALDDDTLNPPMPACTKCPQRTAVQTLLFPELAESDCCLNGVCYATKVAVLVERAATQAESEYGQKPVLVSTVWYPQDKQLVSRNDYKEVDQDTPGAVPAIFADAREGEVVFVKLKAALSDKSDDIKQHEKAERDATILKNSLQRRTNWLTVEALAEALRTGGPWRELLEQLVQREVGAYGGPSRDQRAWLHEQFDFPAHDDNFGGHQSIGNYLAAGMAKQSDTALLTLIILWPAIKAAHFEYVTVAQTWAEAGGRIDVAKLRQQAERELAAPPKGRKPKATAEQLGEALNEVMGKEAAHA